MTEKARAGLCDTFGDDELALTGAVNNGLAQLLEINDGDSYSIIRIDDGEFVCCCYQGKEMIVFAEYIMKRAKDLGFRKFRFHTQRPAMGKIMKKCGFELSEYVFKYNLSEA